LQEGFTESRIDWRRGVFKVDRCNYIKVDELIKKLRSKIETEKVEMLEQAILGLCAALELKIKKSLWIFSKRISTKIKTPSP
jgi:hypothetical protein